MVVQDYNPDIQEAETEGSSRPVWCIYQVLGQPRATFKIFINYKQNLKNKMKLKSLR